VFSLKQRKNEVTKEKDDEIANLNQQTNDLKRQMTKIKQERDDYHRKLNDATHHEDEIHQRDQMISDLQDQIAKLNKEVLEILHSRKENDSRYMNTTPDMRMSYEKGLDDFKKSSFENKSTMDQTKGRSEVDKLKEKISELMQENNTLKTQVETSHGQVY
jgi:chromosome segregation ATPase